jgi:hypothetical protein
MKIFVFTNAQGKVIGSFTPHEKPDPKAPTFHPIPHPHSEYVVHEIEAPDHLRNITSAADLHQELASLIKPIQPAS